MNSKLTLREKIYNAFFNTWAMWKTGFSKLSRKFYAQQHQLTSTTSTDRYPELFAEAARASQESGPITILSYGCSTGEECFSLLNYFNHAKIIGVDINKRNLKKANKRNSYQEVKFLFSTDENIRAEGKYNLIFCLSVLCRWEDTKFLSNCEKVYPFSKFDATVSMLTEQLLPGGLFVLYNSNFCFEDTSAFRSFETVLTPTVKDSGFVYKFDRSNNRIHTKHVSCIYRKK
jgi:hypothetical protein